MTPFRSLISQIAKFGGVGICATATHVAFFSLFIEIFGISQLVSNFLAFCLAFGVSFFGHFYWTFASDARPGRDVGAALPRFLVTALIGLGLNTGIVFIVDAVLRLPYLYSVLGMTFLVPPILFLISRYWAFFQPKALD